MDHHTIRLLFVQERHPHTSFMDKCRHNRLATPQRGIEWLTSAKDICIYVTMVYIYIFRNIDICIIYTYLYIYRERERKRPGPIHES